MNRKLYAPELIFSAVAAISLLICVIGCVVPEGSQVGDNAPDFTLSTLGGGQIKLADLEGQPVIITFWTTGCSACIYQMPFLQEAYVEIGNTVQFIAIDIQQDSYSIQSFMDSYQTIYDFNITIALDSDGTVSEDYNIIFTPTNVVIDSQGIIRHIRKGAFTDTADIIATLSDVD